MFFFFFSSRRRHTRWNCDWSSDVCSSDLRDVVRAKGFISQANHERLWEQDMLPRKYWIAAQLAQERARMPLPQPVSQAFDAAITDGINTFMRDVVLALGFISEENYARLAEQDMLP